MWQLKIVFYFNKCIFLTILSRNSVCNFSELYLPYITWILLQIMISKVGSENIQNKSTVIDWISVSNMKQKVSEVYSEPSWTSKTRLNFL